MQLDALALPFPDHSFDVICAMDFLEHIEMPAQIIKEAARLLKPGGLFFFHTFNRNWLSWLLVIKGVEWCMPNTPANMHVYSYFIKPSELQKWCETSGMKCIEMKGFSPRVASKAFWKSVVSRKIEKGFEFKFSSSLQTGYLGIAQLIG
jgi:2-polyprenyl-6-hydroxyphenyl methylase/3-demethylubiquinone-9 3-methyltransferase